jgi:NADH dehydrogenase
MFNMKHVVIIGGGFGGVNLINKLAGQRGFTITLVDRNNYNFFPPLLYQIATGFLEVSNISYPFRKLLREKKINFHIGEFERIIPEESKVVLSTGEIKYDYLVLATGVLTNYFGMENVKRNALPMKTLSDALDLRNHILQQLELATIETDDRERKKLLNIVVVGTGPTGVEISGMLADMRRHILPKDYPELAATGIIPRIYLVDALDAVLKPMSERSHNDAHKALTNNGVEIKLHMQVKDYVGDAVVFSNGESIDTRTVIWAAGVTGVAFAGMPPGCFGRGNRIMVDEFNRVKGMDNVFAIGDACIQSHEAKFPNGHPQMAQVAIQQGMNLAKNLSVLERGEALKAFAYHDKGSMAIICKNKAVVDMPGNKVHFKGFIAWFMWLFIHLLSLIRHRNRVSTLYNWANAYFASDQPLRMIIRPSEKMKTNT